jgi:serine/threonine protein kinase
MLLRPGCDVDRVQRTASSKIQTGILNMGTSFQPGIPLNPLPDFSLESAFPRQAHVTAPSAAPEAETAEQATAVLGNHRESGENFMRTVMSRMVFTPKNGAKSQSIRAGGDPEQIAFLDQRPELKLAFHRRLFKLFASGAIKNNVLTDQQRTDLIKAAIADVPISPELAEEFLSSYAGKNHLVDGRYPQKEKLEKLGLDGQVFELYERDGRSAYVQAPEYIDGQRNILGPSQTAELRLARRLDSGKEIALKFTEKSEQRGEDGRRLTGRQGEIALNEIRMVNRLPQGDGFTAERLHREFDDRIVLGMDLLRGDSFFDDINLLYACGTDEEVQKGLLTIARFLTGAVAKMHAKDLYHNDLRAENGDSRKSDGVHQLIDPAFGDTGNKPMLNIMGTPGYLDPNFVDKNCVPDLVVIDESSFRRALDLYALGATLYSMEVGQPYPSHTKMLCDAERYGMRDVHLKFTAGVENLDDIDNLETHTMRAKYVPFARSTASWWLGFEFKDGELPEGRNLKELGAQLMQKDPTKRPQAVEIHDRLNDPSLVGVPYTHEEYRSLIEDLKSRQPTEQSN